MRRRRTIYFNDARHYHLWIYDPPIRLKDAYHPVDEVSGTAVDTFAYGVARGDGVFWPTKVGLRFGEDMRPFETAIYWHAWENMQSLIDRGLDPLGVLIDRAHEKGMDFFASYRMGSYADKHAEYSVKDGGRGLADPGARDYQFELLEELTTQYPVEGLELDLAAVPGGGDSYFRAEDARENTSVMNEHVRRISEMVRSRSGEAGQVGARVLPTEEMNLRQGLDVRAWLKEGLLDYVVPLAYSDLQLDPDMPIDWLVEAAHGADVSIYGMLQPYVYYSARSTNTVKYPTPEIMRAAEANYWSRGVDGLYTWFMHWPLGETERSILTEMGDPDLIAEESKRYVLRRRTTESEEAGYSAGLTVDIPKADPAKRYPIPFYIGDDVEGSSDRIRQVQLRIRLMNVVLADRFTILLNGKSLAGETCLRSFGRFWLSRPGPHLHDPRGHWLEFHLKDVLPHKGQNVLEISLDSRPEGLIGGVTVEDVEVFVEYGPFPTGLVHEPSS